MLARHGAGTLAAYRRCGWTGIGVALLFSLSTFGFVLGNQYTKGGNVLMILAGAPLIAALLSRLFLGERLARHTWLAIWLCLAGTSLIVLDDAGAGSWVGNGFALLAATALAANFTLCRTRPGVDMSPMLTLSGLIVAATVGLFGLAGGGIALPPADSLLLLVLLCLVLLPLGFSLIQRGPLYLPAAEVGLLMLLEVVVGTLWVWWILAERPAPVALLGGALVLGTLLAKGSTSVASSCACGPGVQGSSETDRIRRSLRNAAIAPGDPTDLTLDPTSRADSSCRAGHAALALPLLGDAVAGTPVLAISMM